MNHVKEVKILPHTAKNGDVPAAMNPDCQSSAEREFRLELSHKLRTPLNVIIGFTELVARRLGTAKDPDIQHILKSAREMLEIMNRELGREYLFPAVPAAIKTAPIEAAIPIQMVFTSGRTYCMVS